MSSQESNKKSIQSQKVSDLEKIKEGLKDNSTSNIDAKDIFNLAFENLKEEEKEIQDFFKNESNMNEKLEKQNDNFNLNDDLFEVQMRNILCHAYNLKEYLLYPYFRVEPSQNKNSNIIKIYYYKINFFINQKYQESIYFLDDRKTFLSYYKGFPMIFHKKNKEFKSLTVISEDFNYSVEFEFAKKSQLSKLSFLMADISRDIIETEGKIKQTENERDSNNYSNSNTKEQTEKLNKRIESLERKFKLLKKKYSKENIYYELEKKKDEKELLEEDYKLEEIEQSEYEQKISEIEKEINKKEMLLQEITITIERLDEEFDGLFFSSKEIKLENTIGDVLVIPEKNPIIIEIINIINYNVIIDNIKSKKKILESLGFKNFYYIGILRGIDVDKDQKEDINSKKNFDFSKTIIIYPDNLYFLNVQIHASEKGVKEIKKEDEKESILYNKIKEMLQEEFSKFADKIILKFGNLTKESTGTKDKMNNMNNELLRVKSQVSNLNNEMTDIRSQVNNLNSEMIEVKSSGD